MVLADSLGGSILAKKGNSKSLEGRIIKGVGGIFKVSTDSKTLKCSARGLLKRGEDKLYVGDYVILKEEKGVWYIDDVKPRKNLLIRPYVSNVDYLLIVIAPLPEPDYVLLDKLLIYCIECDVTPIIVINKCDIESDIALYVNKVYGDQARIYSVSANSGEGLEALMGDVKGTVCLAGQSAVGKTSLLNKLLDLSMETGELSKIQRGRNTTRHIEIFKYRDMEIVDTCGFSMYELTDFNEYDLYAYYPDFACLGRCKFSTCTHINEPDCRVKEAVDKGSIDKGRYERYLAIYKEIEELRRRLI